MTEELKPCPNCEPCADHPRAEPKPCPFCGGTGVETVFAWRNKLKQGQQALDLLREYPLENLGMQHGAWLAKRKAILEESNGTRST